MFDGSLSTETSIAIYSYCYQRSEINLLKLKEEVRGASQSVASEVKKIKTVNDIYRWFEKNRLHLRIGSVNML